MKLKVPYLNAEDFLRTVQIWHKLPKAGMTAKELRIDCDICVCGNLYDLLRKGLVAKLAVVDSRGKVRNRYFRGKSLVRVGVGKGSDRKMVLVNLNDSTQSRRSVRELLQTG